MNSQLLQQIANPRPLKVPDAVEGLSNAMQLRNAAQAGQMNALNIQDKQQDIEKQRLATEQGAKINGILADPAALDADGNYTAATLQKVKAINYAAGDAIHKAQEGALTASSTRAKTDAETADIKRKSALPVETAHPPGSKVTVRDSTGKVISEYTVPPADKNIDPNSPEGIAAAVSKNPPRTITTDQGVMQYNPQSKKFDTKVGDRPPSQANPDSGAPVAIIGPDGKPVLVPRSEAFGHQPASSREQGRAVTSGDAGRIADFDTSLNDLVTLRQTIPTGATGTRAKVGAMLPNAVTDLTGWGTEAKQKQAVIDRVKQVIGKALEGGVLRKEDEAKYEKILPALADTAAVVKSKLDGLEKAITQRRLTTLDALEDAGYDVARYRTRSGNPTANPYRK